MKYKPNESYQDYINTFSPLFDKHYLDDKLIEREDNWKKKSYDNRYLDALARMFNVNKDSPVAAIIELNKKDKFGIAFNNSLEPLGENTLKTAIKFRDFFADMQEIAKNMKTLLKPATVKAIGGDINGLLFNPYIKLTDTLESFNKILSKADPGVAFSFISIMLINSRSYKECIDEALDKEEENKKHLSTLKTLKQAIENHNHDKVLQTYQHLINEVDEYLKPTKELFIRPLQDLYKLKNYFGNQGINKIILEIIPNKDEMHAEMASANYCLVEEISLKYIGISKLSCYLCHHVINFLKVEYRGTHGIFYSKDWKLSGILKEKVGSDLTQLLKKLHDDIANELPDKLLAACLKFQKDNNLIQKYMEENKISLNSYQSTYQYDDLSDDESIEQQILVTSDKSLWRIKGYLPLEIQQLETINITLMEAKVVGLSSQFDNLE